VNSNQLHPASNHPKQPAYCGRNDFAGFTLVELLVTISIAAILLSVAVPSFQDFFRNSRLASQSNDLLASLALSRSEAIRRGGRVTLCPRDPAEATPTCKADGNWADGWIVFADIQDGRSGRAGATGTINGNDVVIRVVNGLPTGSTLGSGDSFDSWLTFGAYGAGIGSDGDADGTADSTFTLCYSGQSRVITVLPSGATRVTQGTC